jgi:hypothetical protein
MDSKCDLIKRIKLGKLPKMKNERDLEVGVAMVYKYNGIDEMDI